MPVQRKVGSTEAPLLRQSTSCPVLLYSENGTCDRSGKDELTSEVACATSTLPDFARKRRLRNACNLSGEGGVISSACLYKLAPDLCGLTGTVISV